MVDLKQQLLQFKELKDKKLIEIASKESTQNNNAYWKLHGSGRHVEIVLSYSDNPHAKSMVESSMMLLKELDRDYGFGVFND